MTRHYFLFLWITCFFKLTGWPKFGGRSSPIQIFMFSLGSLFSKTRTESVYKGLKVDMHSHLIPGIDDGSPDIATSLTLLRGLADMGYEKVITTPHVLRDLYPNDSAIIKAGHANLLEALQAGGVAMDIEVAAEYFIDQHLERFIESDDILSFGQRRFVLVEMSFVSASPNLESVVFSLLSRGYQPILAHPERYGYLTNHLGFYQRLADLGCMLQVNVLSLVGYYGKTVQNWANTLVAAGMVEFLGTDLHHERHLTLLTEHQFNPKLTKIIEKYPFKNHELLA